MVRPAVLRRASARVLWALTAPAGATFGSLVSDTQAYKQFGNSVAVPAVKAVASHMAPHIRKATEKEAGKKQNRAERRWLTL